MPVHGHSPLVLCAFTFFIYLVFAVTLNIQQYETYLMKIGCCIAPFRPLTDLATLALVHYEFLSEDFPVIDYLLQSDWLSAPLFSS